MSWFEQIDQEILDFLFTIRFNFKNLSIKSYQRDPRPDIDINVEDIQNQLNDAPNIYAFWAMLLIEQKKRVAIIEQRIKKIRGEIVEKTIADCRANKVEYRTTELKEIINADSDLQLAEAELLNEEYRFEKLKVVVEALDKKFEALRSLSGFKKEELRNA